MNYLTIITLCHSERNVIIKAVVIRCRLLRRGLLRLRGGLRLGRGTLRAGLAHALFATALGLIAAIPAVIAYNKLSNDLGRYAHRLENFATEFGAILSRQMDEGA